MREVEVIAGVFVQGDRVLIARRAPCEKLSGLWEFPGGKQEPGETPESCLERELLEELGVSVKVGAYLGLSEYSYSEVLVRLRAYWVTSFEGEIELSVHDRIEWVTREQIVDFALAPADVPFVDMINDQWYQVNRG